MLYPTDSSDNLPHYTTSRINNPGLYHENHLVMPVLDDEPDDEPSMPRPASAQAYDLGYFTNLLNENNQHYDIENTPFSFPSMQRHPAGAMPSSIDQPLFSTGGFPVMTTMPAMPTMTPMPEWGMGSAPSMATMPAVAPMTSMPAGWTMGPPNPITTGPPPVPLATRPNMRKCTTRMPATIITSGPATADVVDEHQPKAEGAYYPPTKRIKREHADTPRKPSWAISSETDDASLVSLPRPPREEQAPANNSRRAFSTSYNTHSSVPAAPQQCPVMQSPPAPIIPTPLEAFPEAGTIMNFPLPQIDHQGQRPASAEGYISILDDDLLYQTREPYEIEMAYRAALRVRERVDWDCRRLGLRLRYLRRCQARAAERYRATRECEWQRGDFGEQSGDC